MDRTPPYKHFNMCGNNQVHISYRPTILIACHFQTQRTYLASFDHVLISKKKKKKPSCVWYYGCCWLEFS